MVDVADGTVNEIEESIPTVEREFPQQRPGGVPDDDPVTTVGAARRPFHRPRGGRYRPRQSFGIEPGAHRLVPGDRFGDAVFAVRQRAQEAVGRPLEDGTPLVVVLRQMDAAATVDERHTAPVFFIRPAFAGPVRVHHRDRPPERVPALAPHEAAVAYDLGHAVSAADRGSHTAGLDELSYPAGGVDLTGNRGAVGRDEAEPTTGVGVPLDSRPVREPIADVGSGGIVHQMRFTADPAASRHQPTGVIVCEPPPHAVRRAPDRDHPTGAVALERNGAPVGESLFGDAPTGCPPRFRDPSIREGDTGFPAGRVVRDPAGFLPVAGHFNRPVADAVADSIPLPPSGDLDHAAGVVVSAALHHDSVDRAPFQPARVVVDPPFLPTVHTLDHRGATPLVQGDRPQHGGPFDDPQVAVVLAIDPVAPTVGGRERHKGAVLAIRERRHGTGVVDLPDDSADRIAFQARPSTVRPADLGEGTAVVVSSGVSSSVAVPGFHEATVGIPDGIAHATGREFDPNRSPVLDPVGGRKPVTVGERSPPVSARFERLDTTGGTHDTVHRRRSGGPFHACDAAAVAVYPCHEGVPVPEGDCAARTPDGVNQPFRPVTAELHGGGGDAGGLNRAPILLPAERRPFDAGLIGDRHRSTDRVPAETKFVPLAVRYPDQSSRPIEEPDAVGRVDAVSPFVGNRGPPRERGAASIPGKNVGNSGAVEVGEQTGADTELVGVEPRRDGRALQLPLGENPTADLCVPLRFPLKNLLRIAERRQPLGGSVQER